MIRSPEFDDWVAEARAADILAEAERHGAKLKRDASEFVGPCPACGGTDRFSVNLREKVFFCRGAGRGGDVIELVRYLAACDFMAACEALTGRGAPSGKAGTVDEAELARRAAAREVAAQKRAREAQKYREDERRRAHGIWRSFGPRDLVVAYLAGRGLDMPPRVLRCHPDLPYWIVEDLPSPPVGEGGLGRQPEPGEGARGPGTPSPRSGLRPESALSREGRGKGRPRQIFSGPAMMAAIVDDRGVFSGVHLTWIDPHNPGKKATIVHPGTGEILPAKKMRGSLRRAHIPLVTRDAPKRLVIGEGIETVLTVERFERLFRPELWAITEYWAAGSLGQIGGKAENRVPHPTELFCDRAGKQRRRMVPGEIPLLDPERDLMPPAAADEILLLADGDDDPFKVEMAMKRAAARWARPGRRVEPRWAPPNGDFNNLRLAEVCA